MDKTVSFSFLETLGAKVTLPKEKGHNSTINTSISPPFIPSSVLRSMMLWPQSGSAAKIGAGVVQSFPCPWIPTFWSWLHWHFRVRKRSQPKKAHLIFECFFRNIFNPSFFWWWFNRPFSVLYRKSQWHESCRIEADYAGHRHKKKSALHDPFSLKPSSWKCHDSTHPYQIQLPSLKLRFFTWTWDGWKTWDAIFAGAMLVSGSGVSFKSYFSRWLDSLEGGFECSGASLA